MIGRRANQPDKCEPKRRRPTGGVNPSLSMLSFRPLARGLDPFLVIAVKSARVLAAD